MLVQKYGKKNNIMPNIILNKVTALTEKNRLKPAVATAIRTKEIGNLETALTKFGYQKMEGKNSMVLTFEDKNGVEFIARVDLVVTLPTAPKEKTAKKSKNDIEIIYEHTPVTMGITQEEFDALGD